MGHMGRILTPTSAALLLAAFGCFLIWKGMTGDVVRLSSGRAVFPAWFYILGGLVVLILPAAYLWVWLFR